MLLEVGWSVPTGKIVSSVVQGKLMEKVLLDLFLLTCFLCISISQMFLEL
jgi:hypothetical protein